MTAASTPNGRDTGGCEKRHCHARRKSGGVCHRPAGWGTSHPGAGTCKLHLGSTADHTKYAQGQQARELVKTYGLPIDISPTEALLEEVRWTAGHVAWLRQRVQETEQQQLTVGVAEQRIDPGGGKTVKIKTAPNVWLDLYAAERRHLVDVCAAALRAGIEERQIRLAERHGQLMEVFIRGVLADLLLTPAQEALVPTVVPRRLRELIAGGPTT
jgi:hypothetical protein